MICPRCRIGYVAHTESTPIGVSGDSYETGRLITHNCPECGCLIIHFNKKFHEPGMGIIIEEIRDFSDSILLYPKKRSPPDLQIDLLEEYKEDFEEPITCSILVRRLVPLSVEDACKGCS